MHVDGRVRRILWYSHILCQVRSRNKGECRRAGISRPGMAQCAQIDLPIPGEFCRVNDVSCLPWSLMRALCFDMRLPWTVALFTSDPQNHTGLIKMIERRRQGFDIGCMTLQAQRNDWLIEIR